MNHAPPNPLREGTPDEQGAPPCSFVIFGASGDLTRRKLLPALYNLGLSRSLPHAFSVIGVARRPKTDASFGEEMREAVAKHSRRKPLDLNAWTPIEQGIGYVQGSFEQAKTYHDLKARLQRSDAERGTAQDRKSVV